jgi:hypothetical protein
MLEWWLLLTPVLVLPIFLLFRFVGCDGVFGLVHVSDIPSYDDVIKGEASLLAYWRLADAANATDALDETGKYSGLYAQPAALPAHDDSQAATGEVLRAQPAVHGDGTSVDFRGGYVVVPFGPDLSATSFTVEAWVQPDADWQSGFNHGVLAFAEQDATTQRGFSLYGGWYPLEQKYYWAAAIGSGTAYMPVKGAEVKMPPEPTYVALTYDESTGMATLYVGAPGAWQSVTPMPLAFTPAGTNHFYIGAQSNALPPTTLPLPQPAPDVTVPFLGRAQLVAYYGAALDDAVLAKHRG